MRNKEDFKKKILYRSTHRGNKEMDMLLGNFVKKNIELFKDSELLELSKLIEIEDKKLKEIYFSKINKLSYSKNKVLDLFINFKL